MPTLELKPVVREGLPTVTWLVVVDEEGIGTVQDTRVSYRVCLSKGNRSYETVKEAANALLRDCGIKGRF